MDLPPHPQQQNSTRFSLISTEQLHSKHTLEITYGSQPTMQRCCLGVLCPGSHCLQGQCSRSPCLWLPVVPALISGRTTAAPRAALCVHLCRLSPVPSILTQGTTSSTLLTARLPAWQGMQALHPALRAWLHSSTTAGTSCSFSGCRSVSLQTL